MRFPLPWSLEALGVAVGRSKRVPGTSQVLRGYQLSALKGRASQTGVERLTGTSDPSSFCCLFKQNLVGEGTSIVGRQV